MTSAALQARALPLGALPLGLSRAQAAAYIGVSTGLFDRLVLEGLMPAPKQLAARTVWDRRALEAAFAALPTRGGPPPVTPGVASGTLQGDSAGETALDANPWDAPE